MAGSVSAFPSLKGWKGIGTALAMTVWSSAMRGGSCDLKTLGAHCASLRMRTVISSSPPGSHAASEPERDQIVSVR
jgi:hypothetical protein